MLALFCRSPVGDDLRVIVWPIDHSGARDHSSDDHRTAGLNRGDV